MSRVPRIGRRHRPSMSLFRRLSNRKAEKLSANSQLGIPENTGCTGTANHCTGSSAQVHIRSLSTGADAVTSSDSDSSAGSTGPNSPHNRPSSLHGLQNKIMTSRTTSSMTSLRRQSFHAVPPSPLTRTLPVCPAAISTSPTVTRSLSPLVGGQCSLTAGMSNQSQSYSPAVARNSLSAVETSLYASRRRSASPSSLQFSTRSHQTSSRGQRYASCCAVTFHFSQLCANVTHNVFQQFNLSDFKLEVSVEHFLLTGIMKQESNK